MRGSSRALPSALSCGELAAPLFVGSFVLDGAVREEYRASRHPGSALALGGSGWTQRANFLVTGGLTWACAAGERSAQAPGPGSKVLPRCLAAVGPGVAGAGLFPTDPVSGYPPGTPDLPARWTGSGIAHNLASLPVFGSLPVAALVQVRRLLARHHLVWAMVSLLGGAACVGSQLVASRGFAQAGGLVDRAGLYQRVAIVSGLGWMSLLAARLRAEVKVQ